MIYNTIGFLTLAFSMFVAFAIVWLLNLAGLSIYWYDREWMVAMPIAAIVDIAYRNFGERRWFHPLGGGQFFFLPVWLWGIALFLFAALPDVIQQRAARRCDPATVAVVRVEGRSPSQCAEWAKRGVITSALPGQSHEYSFSGNGGALVCSCKAK